MRAVNGPGRVTKCTGACGSLGDASCLLTRRLSSSNLCKSIAIGSLTFVRIFGILGESLFAVSVVPSRKETWFCYLS